MGWCGRGWTRVIVQSDHSQKKQEEAQLFIPPSMEKAHQANSLLRKLLSEAQGKLTQSWFCMDIIWVRMVESYSDSKK